MANYFPLIANPVGNIITELPAGDFLDLSQSGIANSGSITVSGAISASGNITGSYFFGNGSQLTGIDATSIQNGTSNVRVVSSGGNVAVGIGGTSNVTVFATTGQYVTGLLSASGNITGSQFNGSGAGLTSIPGANVTGTVANATYAVSAGSATTAGTVTTAAQPNITSVGTLTGLDISGGLVVSGTISGNISGRAAVANALGVGIFTYSGNTAAATSTVALRDASADIYASTFRGSGLIVSGAITVNSGAAVTAIVNGATNGVGNIGASGAGFNTVFAKATSAQYADLAENYLADADYKPGTVLSFGGEYEVTVSQLPGDGRVAGVVSTDPAHLMNSGLTGQHVSAIALIGRVPTKVTGQVNKGDFMISAGNGHAQACAEPKLGTVIGKAIQDFDGESGVIEILINNM